jgi:16S rRNA processing protein RimM
MAEPCVSLGEIVTTHGLHGWLKLNPFNLDTQALASGAAVILAKAGERSVHRIEASTRHRSQFLIKLDDVASIAEAEQYVGATLLVDEAALATLEPGQYYHYQVVGFEVFTAAGERVGIISSIFPTAGGELYVIQGPVKEHLVPAVKEFIDRVDFTTRTMIVNPPEGLLDL